MCGYVPTGPGCHHASWQARRRDGWSRGKRLGGGGASDLSNLLEAYRGEKKGVDDVDEGATNPTEETQEIRSVISHVSGIPRNVVRTVFVFHARSLGGNRHEKRRGSG